MHSAWYKLILIFALSLMSESDAIFHTEESNSSLGVLLLELELEASEI